MQAEIAALRARQQAVEDLQGDRNLPVHLLNELVRQLPDGVYLASMKQDNQSVTLQGTAQSNERVSELLRNLGNNSPWLVKPELVEITAGTVNLSPRDQRRVANFTMRIGLKRPTDTQRPVPCHCRTQRGEGLGAMATTIRRGRRQGHQLAAKLRRPIPQPKSERSFGLAAAATLCVVSAGDGTGTGRSVVRLAEQF